MTTKIPVEEVTIRCMACDDCFDTIAYDGCVEQLFCSEECSTVYYTSNTSTYSKQLDPDFDD